jgi:hypothetical protein
MSDKNQAEPLRMDLDELRVRKHVKVQSKVGKIDVHASDSVLGVWVSAGPDSRPEYDTVAVVCDRGHAPYICVYPSRGFRNADVRTPPVQLPVAISGAGIQIPHPDGTASRISWTEVSQLVRAAGK